MRFSTATLLTGATAVAAHSANLLLPGFEGVKDLQANVLGSNGPVTTYLVTCPQPTSCGIPAPGMTAIAGPNAVHLVNNNGDGHTASVSCDYKGNTYASCHAKMGTVEAHSTLQASDLNWMPVTVAPTSTQTPISTSTPTPTPTPQPPRVVPTSSPKPSSTSTLTPSFKSTTHPASSSVFVTSSTPLSPSAPAETPTDSVISDAPEATQAPSQASSSPTSHNAAAPLAGNVWAAAGAFLAFAYALA
ncbi:hypothetical protein NUU61_000284 [Penicillium alfredii]|uniref:Uncharacterized protein n=1 Tax=Penicillium alfredii TaxID=1506179 RepID=A0A9W9KQI0_9EURO|nr:uncharacterized protein NUU61_000284 [Penicillium alfredii]KAJ5114525.1 hypothetical protein NUU61_000284 [Penicillium alfredii]